MGEGGCFWNCLTSDAAPAGSLISGVAPRARLAIYKVCCGGGGQQLQPVSTINAKPRGRNCLETACQCTVGLLQ